MNNSLEAFQAALYQQIPLVRHMQLQLVDNSPNQLVATAPLIPNINDKGTVFGGSSGALMTICGWSLLKHNLELRGFDNDVVIYNSQTDWKQSQQDDLHIKANSEDLDWSVICERIRKKPRSIRVPVKCHVSNAAGQVCTTMNATYVILKAS